MSALLLCIRWVLDIACLMNVSNFNKNSCTTKLHNRTLSLISLIMINNTCKGVASTRESQSVY